MIQNGLMFMAVGMSVVFGFLILMVFVMNAAAGILKNFPEEEETASSPVSPIKPPARSDAEIAAAIAIARAKLRK